MKTTLPHQSTLQRNRWKASDLMWKSSDLIKSRSGGHKIVYEVPGRVDIIIKVRKVPQTLESIKDYIYAKVSFARNRSLKREVYHAQEIESRSYRLGISNPLSRIYGVGKVDGAFGLIVEKICGPSKSGLAPSIREYFDLVEDMDDAISVLNEFTHNLFQLRVVAKDLNHRNIVVDFSNSRKRPRLVLVDGFGERQFVKTRSWISFIRHRDLTWGLHILAQGLNLKFDSKTRRFSRMVNIS